MIEAGAPLRSTGIGSWPGTDLGEALRISFAECPDLPYLPTLPERGPHAQRIGRGTALLPSLSADLQPAGWRLTDASGRDQRRAVATLRSDLDQLEEVAQGYSGWFKLAVAGPWTLAASLERPRGGLVLGDRGARRDVAQSLAEGVAELVLELHRRLPDLAWIVQLDEPSLPAVAAGTVATASGLDRYRAVDRADVSAAISTVVQRLASTGHEVPVAVHCDAPHPPIELLVATGVRALSVDLDQLRPADWDVLGRALEQGGWLGAGVLPAGSPLGPDAVAERVLRPLRALGLDPEVAARTVLTPVGGLAGLHPSAAVATLRTLRTAAAIVGDQLAA